jgi:hypothetical protein
MSSKTLCASKKSTIDNIAGRVYGLGNPSMINNYYLLAKISHFMLI